MSFYITLRQLYATLRPFALLYATLLYLGRPKNCTTFFQNCRIFPQTHNFFPNFIGTKKFPKRSEKVIATNQPSCNEVLVALRLEVLFCSILFCSMKTSIFVSHSTSGNFYRSRIPPSETI